MIPNHTDSMQRARLIPTTPMQRFSRAYLVMSAKGDMVVETVEDVLQEEDQEADAHLMVVAEMLVEVHRVTARVTTHQNTPLPPTPSRK